LKEDQGNGRAKIRAARLSVVSNSVLVLLKLTVGIAIGSAAVLSEAIHSATDLAASIIAFFAVRAADAPPDEDHPYGHGKMESISGLFEAVLIGAAGMFIVTEAIRAIRHPSGAPVGWGIGVMVLSTVVNTFVARHLFAVARRTDSLALEADAHHLSVDVWTSIAVALGLGLVYLTGLRWLDPVVALIVGLFVLRTAWDISRQAAQPLVDRQLPEDEVRAVEQTMRDDDRILSWHKLRTRKSGSERHIDVHIQVDDEMSLREAHAVTEELEDRMRAALPNVRVMIHTEPYEEEKRHHEENPH
jgi:cation diffusion facilitator family transporter